MQILTSYSRIIDRTRRPLLPDGSDAFVWHKHRVKVYREWMRDGLVWTPTYRFAAAYDTATSSGAVSSNTKTFNHTPGSLTQGYVIVPVKVVNSTQTATSGTFNGTAMSILGTAVTDANTSVTLLGVALGTLGSGTYSVVVNVGGSVDFEATAITATGVDQSVSTGGYATNSGATTTPTVTISAAAGDLVIDGTSVGQASGSVSLSANQTQINVTGLVGNFFNVGSQSAAGSASVVMSWSDGAATNWTIAGIAIKGATGASNTLWAQSLM